MTEILFKVAKIFEFTRKSKESLASLVTDPGQINPLSPDINMHILFTDLHTFLMELVRRICLNIKTSYPQ